MVSLRIKNFYFLLFTFNAFNYVSLERVYIVVVRFYKVELRRVVVESQRYFGFVDVDVVVIIVVVDAVGDARQVDHGDGAVRFVFHMGSDAQVVERVVHELDDVLVPVSSGVAHAAFGAVFALFHAQFGHLVVAGGVDPEVDDELGDEHGVGESWRELKSVGESCCLGARAESSEMAFIFHFLYPFRTHASSIFRQGSKGQHVLYLNKMFIIATPLAMESKPQALCSSETKHGPNTLLRVFYFLQKGL
jgi:hypothetical protein